MMMMEQVFSLSLVHWCCKSYCPSLLWFTIDSIAFDWIYISCKYISIMRENACCVCCIRILIFKQGLSIDWLPLNKLALCVCVCAFVWLVDPLCVGPPAPGLLTHIIKAKGVSPSIHHHKDEGHIIICIICLTLSPRSSPTLLFCTSSSSVFCGRWQLVW